MNRKLDEEAAQLIMGWEWAPPRWSPTVNPSADYEILCKVREWPDGDQLWFAEKLCRIWDLRGWPRGAAYQPGDYASAAVAVWRRKEAKR